MSDPKILPRVPAARGTEFNMNSCLLQAACQRGNWLLKISLHSYFSVFPMFRTSTSSLAITQALVQWRAELDHAKEVIAGWGALWARREQLGERGSREDSCHLASLSLLQRTSRNASAAMSFGHWDWGGVRIHQVVCFCFDCTMQAVSQTQALIP